MKKAAYLIPIFLLTLFTACKKNNTEVSQSLVGKWESRGATCFCATIGTPDYSPGNGNITSFDANRYRHYAKGKLLDSGTYVVTIDNTTFKSPANKIVYNNSTTQIETFYKIEGTKLTFYSSVPVAADGFEFYYERQ